MQQATSVGTIHARTSVCNCGTTGRIVMSIQLTRLLTALYTCGMALILSQPAAAAGFGNDNQGCAVDRPCFNGAYQSGNKVIFKFTGVTGWDFYNVRYAHDGGEKQVENRSGSFAFNNTIPHRVYTLSVQGCKSHTLGRSTCSPWVRESVSTK